MTLNLFNLYIRFLCIPNLQPDKFLNNIIPQKIKTIQHRTVDYNRLEWMMKIKFNSNIIQVPKY